MKRFWSVPSALLVVSASLAGAQSVSSKCPPGGFVAPGVPDATKAVQDACQKTLDVFGFMAPQLGTLLAGGNPTLGQGGALGGPGHFTIGVRANALRARVPRVDQVTPSVQGAQRSDYAVEDQIAPLPSIDAAVGVFAGIPLGVTNIFAIDGLVSLTALREFSSENVQVKMNGGSVRLGFGGRVGLLQESIVTPGIAVSYLRRALPIIDIVGTSGNDRLEVNSLEVQSDSWRVTAGKSLIFFSLAAGVGQDRLSSKADVQAHVSRLGFTADAGPIAAEQTVTRTNYFADVSFNLPFVKLVGEIGRATGGSVAETYNTFSGKKPTDALTYGSVGLRFGF